MLYLVGRTLQLIGLLVLPSAIWYAQFDHNEPASLSIFIGSITVFYIGVLISKKH